MEEMKADLLSVSNFFELKQVLIFVTVTVGMLLKKISVVTQDRIMDNSSKQMYSDVIVG